MTFEQWLQNMYKQSNGNSLSENSIKHYKSGLMTISVDMLNEGIINKTLDKMNLFELDYAISIIMNVNSFIKKDLKGNRMYSNALKKYRCFVYHNTNFKKQEINEIKKIKKDSTLNKTEKEALIKSRRGQGLFRSQLKRKYNSRCIITDVDISSVLVASHIKPWFICNNEERLSINNGLLLSATFDRLFDSGLITFKKDGSLMVSDLVSQENIEKLHISDDAIYDIKYNPNMDCFLKYHNDIIFIGNVK